MTLLFKKGKQRRQNGRHGLSLYHRKMRRRPQKGAAAQALRRCYPLRSSHQRKQCADARMPSVRQNRAETMTRRPLRCLFHQAKKHGRRLFYPARRSRPWRYNEETLCAKKGGREPWSLRQPKLRPQNNAAPQGAGRLPSGAAEMTQNYRLSSLLCKPPLWQPRRTKQPRQDYPPCE